MVGRPTYLLNADFHICALITIRDEVLQTLSFWLHRVVEYEA